MRPLLRIRRGGEPLIVLGHRGASAVAPENTLTAFRAAIDAGADGVELDVQVTRDGVAVVHHDSTLRRTAGRRGRLSTTDASTLATLECGSWFSERFAGERVPSLIEVLELLRGSLIVNLEMKRGGGERLVRATIECVRETGVDAQVLLSSFDHGLLAVACSIAPEIARATLMHPLDLSRPSRAALAVGASSVVMSWRQLRRDRVAEAHAAGLPVIVYTVDTPRLLARCERLGVDAVIANDPAGARKVLTGLSETSPTPRAT